MSKSDLQAGFCSSAFDGALIAESIQEILTWGNLLVLAALIVMAAGKADIAHAKPMFSRGLTGIGAAISIIYVSFFGYQLIANTAEEIINPEKTVPRVMLLSMIVSLVFYVEAIRHHGAKALYRIEVASADKPLDFLVERSAEFDLRVAGATKVKFPEKAAVGPFSSQIAMRSSCSVAVVRVAAAVRKIMPI